MSGHWRFSLGTLLLGMFGAAAVCALLPYPATAFGCLLVLLLLAAVLARFGPAGARRFWFWFALFGWLYVVLGTTLIEIVERSGLSAQVWQGLANQGAIPPDWTREHLVMCAHFLLGVCVAFFAATLLCGLRAAPSSRTKMPDNAHNQMRSSDQPPA